MKIILLALEIVILSFSSASWGRCAPSFPINKGWLGSNLAYSIPLAQNKTLWLFGDTFIGTNQKTRESAKLIANSIGISGCQGSKPNISYIWGHKNDVAVPYFQSSDKEIRLWPLDGFSYGGKLYIFLAQILEKPGGSPKDYEYIGVSLARVENPTMVPEAWDMAYLDVLKSTRFFPGASAVLSGAHVYLFTPLQDDLNKNHPVILTRLPLDKLKKPAENLEYYSKEKSWKKGTDLRDAFIIMDSGGLAMSVRLHPELNKWVAIHTQAGTTSSGVVMRIAGSLEGPWSDATLIYSMPEKDSASRGNDPEMFCNAAMEHPESETKDHLFVSYVCNYTQFQKTKYDMKVFIPRTVSLHLRSHGK